MTRVLEGEGIKNLKNSTDDIFGISESPPKEVYTLLNSASSCCISGSYASYESYVRPLSYGVWQIDILPEAVE